MCHEIRARELAAAIRISSRICGSLPLLPRLEPTDMRADKPSAVPSEDAEKIFGLRPPAARGHPEGVPSPPGDLRQGVLSGASPSSRGPSLRRVIIFGR